MKTERARPPAAASTEEPTADEGDGDTYEEPTEAKAEAKAEGESEATESDNSKTE